MMKIVLVCALVAVAAVGAKRPTPRLDGRIVGGRDATIEEFPHQVSLQYFNSHSCGASIISERFVVTAAHCTDGATADILSIRAGSTRHASGGQKLNVRRIMQHPRYNARTTDYDISILELDGALRFGSGVEPINMVDLDENTPVGTTVTVSGWGTTSEGGSIPGGLKAVDLNVISQSSCQADYSPNYDITARMMCAGVGGGKDACQGDSGGPLINPANKQLVGVVSWGIGCARPQYPGVFASVANLRNYIKENTGI